jgi:hypothetical protein
VAKPARPEALSRRDASSPQPDSGKANTHGAESPRSVDEASSEDGERASTPTSNAPRYGWLKTWREARAQVRRQGLWPAEGFGAPLWVLLLAVLGSGLYTIKLIVDFVEKQHARDEAASARTLKDTVQHQLFTLVAPLTAIFVYQGLVATKTASSVLPVALAALASGVTLNALLTKAIQAVPESSRRDPLKGKAEPDRSGEARAHPHEATKGLREAAEPSRETTAGSG